MARGEGWRADGPENRELYPRPTHCPPSSWYRGDFSFCESDLDITEKHLKISLGGHCVSGLGWGYGGLNTARIAQTSLCVTSSVITVASLSLFTFSPHSINADCLTSRTADGNTNTCGVRRRKLTRCKIKRGKFLHAFLFFFERIAQRSNWPWQPLLFLFIYFILFICGLTTVPGLTGREYFMSFVSHSEDIKFHLLCLSSVSPTASASTLCWSECGTIQTEAKL